MVHVGKQVFHVDQALENGHLVTALFNEAGFQVEVVLFVAGIGNIAEVENLLVGEFELARFAQVVDGVDVFGHAANIASLNLVGLGQLIDIDIFGNLVIVDVLVDNSQAVLVHKAVEQGVEAAGIAAVGVLVSLFECTDSFEFFRTCIAAFSVLVVKLNRLHDTHIKSNSQSNDDNTQKDLNQSLTFHDIVLFLFSISVCKDTKKVRCDEKKYEVFFLLLFDMIDNNLTFIVFRQPFGDSFCTKNRPVLPSSTAKTDAKIGKVPL